MTQDTKAADHGLSTRKARQSLSVVRSPGVAMQLRAPGRAAIGDSVPLSRQ